MIGEQLCYIVVYISEAITAIWYMENLFAQKRKFSHIAHITGLGHIILYCISLIEITALNTISFFIANYLILCSCYHCAKRTAILHSAFLSFIMTIAEVLIALLMSIFVDDFAAYSYNLYVMVVMAVLSKSLYLAFALIGAKVYSPHKQTTDEPHMMVSLPIISAIISVFIVYIGLRTELTESTEVMMLINVIALLMRIKS